MLTVHIIVNGGCYKLGYIYDIYAYINIYIFDYQTGLLKPSNIYSSRINIRVASKLRHRLWTIEIQPCCINFNPTVLYRDT